MTHLREKARFRDIGGFGAASRFVGNRLRLFELADQRVLFGTRLERRQRGGVKPVGEKGKVAFRGQRHEGENVIVQRALDGEIECQRDGDRQRQREYRDRQARRQHARYRHHQKHDEQHEGGRLVIHADRVDQNEGPRHAEKKIEHDEAHAPSAQRRGPGRFVEELTARANDDEMDKERAGGPHAADERPGPQPGERTDGDDQQENDG